MTFYLVTFIVRSKQTTEGVLTKALKVLTSNSHLPFCRLCGLTWVFRSDLSAIGIGDRLRRVIAKEDDFIVMQIMPDNLAYCGIMSPQLRELLDLEEDQNVCADRPQI